MMPTPIGMPNYSLEEKAAAFDLLWEALWRRQEKTRQKKKPLKAAPEDPLMDLIEFFFWYADL
jgi:hypothetical protein